MLSPVLQEDPEGDAVSPALELSLTTAYTVLYSLLFGFVYLQLWLILHYGYKRFSYQSAFLFLCLLWAALRTTLFSFYFENAAQAMQLQPLAYWLLYCCPVCLQFFTLCLLNLYFWQVRTPKRLGGNLFVSAIIRSVGQTKRHGCTFHQLYCAQNAHKRSFFCVWVKQSTVLLVNFMIDEKKQPNVVAPASDLTGSRSNLRKTCYLVSQERAPGACRGLGCKGAHSPHLWPPQKLNWHPNTFGWAIHQTSVYQPTKSSVQQPHPFPKSPNSPFCLGHSTLTRNIIFKLASLIYVAHFIQKVTQCASHAYMSNILKHLNTKERKTLKNGKHRN